MFQEIQPAKDIGLICCKTLPTKSVTCLQVGPCPLSGRRLYLQDPTNPALHFPTKIHLTNNKGTLSLLLHIYVGGAMLFKHLKCHKVVQIGTRLSIFLMVVSDVSPGIQEFWLVGSVSSSQIPGS